MSDTEKTAETVDPASTTEVPDIAKLAEQLEQIKRAQAGSDKAYQEAAKKASELSAENEKLKKEKMSDREKAEFEIAKKTAELEVRAREVAEATLRLSKVKMMGEKGIDLEYADYITGSTEQELAQSLDTFSKRLEKLVAARVETTLKGSPKPQAGSVPPKQENFAGMSFKELERLAKDGKL
jgi:hypothetical protein